MWEILRRKTRIALACLSMSMISTVGALAQDTFINQNISGFNLPGVQLPQGHDEVRAADGTTCRAAVSGAGAYLDIGLIGNPEQNWSWDSGSMSAYGRVVIPLGKKAPRLDCGRLYDLEVARLEMELKLMQMGLARGIAPVSEGYSSSEADVSADDDTIQLAEVKEESWADDGWTTDGLKE